MDMVEYMDTTVGKLVDGPEELGLREGTVVLFYSENGTHLKISSQMQDGRTVQGGKATSAQTGIHVSLITNWPGKIKADSLSHHVIDRGDLLPTIAELARPKAEDRWQLDCFSFVPQLFDEPGSPRDSCFFCYGDPTDE